MAKVEPLTRKEQKEINSSRGNQVRKGIEMKLWRGIRTLMCAAIVAAMPIASLPSMAVPLPAPAAKTRPTGTPAIRRAARVIAKIAARQDTCRYDKTMPSEMEECDGAAIDAYDKLLPRARTHSIRQDFLAEMIGVFLEAQNGDRAYYPNYAVADTVTAVARYADFARRHAEILTGVAKVPPPRKPGRGERGLFDWIDRTPDLRAVISTWLSTRQVTRRWVAIREADCAAYPVPRCAERLDHEMRLMIRDLTREVPTSFEKGEKRPPRRF